MKLENVDYNKILRNAGHFLMENKVVVTSIVMLAVGVLVLQRINSLTDPGTDQTHLESELESIEEVTFDDEAIEQITELDSTDIEITSDFTDRQNPFRDN